MAEQIAAEDARRRDPVKRTLFAGGGLVAFMLVWIAANYAKIKTVENEVASVTAQLTQVEDASKEVRANYGEINQIRSKMEALDKYANNRFFWGTFLDSLQHISVGDLRLTEVRGEHTYRENDGTKLLSTNLVIATGQKAPFWKFWASANAAESPAEALNKALGSITNRAVFQTNRVGYTMKQVLVPNPVNTIAKLEFTSLPSASEQIKVELRGRDYGKRPGYGIDEFAERLSKSEFFQEWLSASEGYRFTERPPQPRPDPNDPINPGSMFVPFTIECLMKERIFTHD